MTRLSNTFEFIGVLNFGKEIVKEVTFDSGWTKKQANIIINESTTNGVFVTLEGGYNKGNGKSNNIFTFGKNLFGEKGEKLEVAWEDRKQPHVLEMVADFKKIIVDLTVDEQAKEEYYKLRNEIFNLESKSEDVTTEDRKKLKELYAKVKETVPHRYEFIHGLDAVEFFGKVAEKVKGKKFRVKGDVTVSAWKGKFYTNYVPTIFELVSDETDNKLSAQLDLYFTKEAKDESLWKDNKTIHFNTYIYSYDSGHRADKVFPLQTIFNGKNRDFDTPYDAALLNIIKKYTTVQGRGVWHIPFEVSIYRGAEVIEPSIENLTASQRELIELGLRTAEDFKEKGKMFGNSVSEIRLEMPLIKNFGEGNDYSNGLVETNLTLEDLIYTPPAPKEAKSSDQSSSTPPPKNKPLEINLDDLPF